MDRNASSRVVYEAILRALAADPKTREPLNALVVWTEIGKGFAGLLDRKGADVGLLSRLIQAWSRDRGAAPRCDLSHWAYAVPQESRLTVAEIGEALRRAQFQIERALVASGHTEGADAVREAFLTSVRGWFAAGPQILRAFPAARAATQAEVWAALAAWCERYLPKDPASAKDLGVRIAREAPAP